MFCLYLTNNEIVTSKKAQIIKNKYLMQKTAILKLLHKSVN